MLRGQAVAAVPGLTTGSSSTIGITTFFWMICEIDSIRWSCIKNKMEESIIARISVTWRGSRLDVDADPSCTGIELNPPPSEALKRMHMLACDPGIIAIMNKHKWRVGIMTEMAPVGYVGVSC
ncbi:hypothetical protein SEVIR_4G300300v4 [Setaria viridis]|uniref:WLM domain-containing protein n=1 Tax=Setaria viridis TaxID=4556 RepID=A0A4U6V381_SETVI|nr:uncharacterized protein LOC117853257 [Setaria viridis]TKW23570.1 hypothetical protein SEVIR_4G300300v2 [Setaria viridis]